MEITDEIICSVFAQYPKAPIAIYEEGCDPVSHYLEGVDFCNNEIIAERVHWKPKQIKLILKPVSSITDEDALQIAKIIGITEEKDLRDAVEQKNDLINILSSFERNEEAHTSISSLDVFFTYQYLQLRGYDLPNYLLERKTLFESGLAIYK